MVLRLRNISKYGKRRPAAFEDGISEYCRSVTRAITRILKVARIIADIGSDRKYSQTSHSRSVILSGI